MKTTKRFDIAVQKLYAAFHNDTLNPECCTACAVGNILDNTDAWKNFTDSHGSVKLNYVGHVNQAFGKRFNGYTPLELLNIEAVFLNACGYQLPILRNSNRPKNSSDADMLFDGLDAVIAHLCKLDGISNIMDYSEAFRKIADQKTTSLQTA